MEQKEVRKEKDVNQIVRQLTTTFGKATEGLERAFRGKKTGANQAYAMQVEFAYKLNEIMQGPSCMLNKHITDANEYIDSVIIAQGQQTDKAS